MHRRECRILAGLMFLTLKAGLAQSLSPQGCDTWVAMQDATADGSVILAKNSDRPPMEAQPLVYMPHEKHSPGETVKCTYISIPQAPVTHEHLGSRIWWAFGYEQGMNEYGVAIGNEAVFSKEPYQWGDGLLGMDLLRLGLERGTNAYEAMHVIIGLLEKYGQSGDCERAGEWGKANYHNSFIIADPKSAWVLETAGRYWVAKRIQRGVYSISNIYSIETEWEEAHPKLVQHAIEMGWARSPKDFNFARDYGDYWRKDSPDPGAMQIRRNTSLSACQAISGKIDPAAMMKLLRNHNEGTNVAPRWSAPESFWPTLCMHDKPRAGYHSAASLVCHLRDSMPPILRQVYWAGFSNPCSNVFKPFYLHGPKPPASYAQGTSTYSTDSPWWWANRIKLLCELNFQALNPLVRGTFDETEKWILQRQGDCETHAFDFVKNQKQDAAIALLQNYQDENCSRIAGEYKRLNEELPAKLDASGIRFLFSDYLKDWTSRSAVPLPIKSSGSEKY